jgi:hypothetical protein
MDLDIQKFKSDIETAKSESKVKAVGRSAGALTMETATKILEKIKTKKQLPTIELALGLVAGVVQNGGSNLNAGSSVFYSIGEATLGSSELKQIVESEKPGGTVRQLCRTLRDEIAQIAIIINEPGDLAKQMRLVDPSITDIEACWCSNYQTGNPNCPEKVRRWLTNNYNFRFSK